MKKEIWIPLLIIIIIAFGGLSVWYWIKKSKEKKATDDKDVKKNTTGGGVAANAQILALQKELNSKLSTGDEKLLEDGILGPKTRAAYLKVYGKNYGESAVNTTTTTSSNIDFKALADALFAAMNNPGTKVNLITENIGKLKNADDWNAVKTAFGTRMNSMGNFSGDLLMWLKSEYKTEAPITVLELQNTLLKIGVNETIA